MYLLLAIFWFVFGVVVQYYWDTLARFAFVIFPRELVAIFCFVMFSYNFIRWRMARSLAQAHEVSNEPPPPKPRREYDPTFDFSDGDDKKPTA